MHSGYTNEKHEIGETIYSIDTFNRINKTQLVEEVLEVL